MMIAKLLSSVSKKSGGSELSTGEAAEQHARKFLCSQGMAFVTQNFRSKYGEIDLIFMDAETLVFIEVRYRKNNLYGSALDSVTASKQNKIRITAQHYLQKRVNASMPAIRFDVVGITPGDVQWIKNAF